jgi:hypothetical protein
MSNSKIDMPSQFGELAAQGRAMLKQGGRVRREALRQGLAVLRTGRVGAEKLPFVQQAVAQSRQATAQAVGTTQAEIARRKITGPFAGRALAGVRTAGAARTAAIPTDIAQSVINQAVPLAQQSSQLGLGALGQAGQAQFSKNVFNAQAFSQAVPFMQTGSRGLIGGICLHPETPVDAPKGPIAIQDIRPGDEVFSEDAEGNRVAVVVTHAIARRVLPSHAMLEVVCPSGAKFLVSPKHPLPAGNPISDLVKGRLVTNTTRYTYDILVGSASGLYFVHGLALGSTLNRAFFRA